MAQQGPKEGDLALFLHGYNLSDKPESARRPGKTISAL